MSTMSTLSVPNPVKTIKCQPVASQIPDLIQTVAGSWLARQNKKITKNKIYKSSDVNKTIQPSGTKSNYNTTNKTKKCQPAASHTPDLIQTECVADSWLARQNKKITKHKTHKLSNVHKTFQPSGTRSNYNTTNKTKKCQPAASHTPDLIQTECVADSWLARQNKKITKQKTHKSSNEYKTFQPSGTKSNYYTKSPLK